MTSRLNVRIRGIVHAHAHADEQITRCGTRYHKNGELARANTDGHLRPMGHGTNNGVECMTCLVKDEWAHADIREIIESNSVKDIQEAVDVRYVDAILLELK